MRFSDIPGHEDEKQKLREMIDAGRMPHALLLHGPQGVGKTMLALAAIQYINCSRRSGGDSCGVCPECRQTAALGNPDVHYVYPVLKRKNEKHPVSVDWLPEWKKMLSEHPWMEPEAWGRVIDAGNSQPMIYVSESDDISQAASLSAYSSDYKIFLVWQSEKLGGEAANKLLKILEEPYSDTLFIFLSNEPGRILPTIFSRLQRMEVGRLSDAEVQAMMEKAGHSPQSAERFARLSAGRPGLAFALASENSEAGEFSAWFRDAMRDAYAMKVDKLRTMSENMAALGREKVMRLLGYFSNQVRENFIYNLGVGELSTMTPEEEQFSTRFSPFIHAGNVERLCSELTRATTDISRNGNAKIVLFDMLLQLMAALRAPKQ